MFFWILTNVIVGVFFFFTAGDKGKDESCLGASEGSGSQKSTLSGVRKPEREPLPIQYFIVLNSLYIALGTEASLYRTLDMLCQKF